MCYVQLPAVLHCQLNGFHRRCKARLLAAYQLVCPYVGVVAVSILEVLCVAVDDGRVLAVCHQRQRRLAEYAVEGLVAVDEHISCRAAHEHLYARNARGVEVLEECRVVVCGSEEEAVVHVALRGGDAELAVEFLECRRLWHGVGHVEDGSHSAGGRRTRLAVDVALRRKSRLPHVHMVVDDAWQHVASCGIDDVLDAVSVFVFVLVFVFVDADNSVVINNNIANKGLAFVDDISVFYQCLHCCCPLLSAGAASSSVSPRMRARMSCALLQ